MNSIKGTQGMGAVVEEYIRSLKMPEAEEILDLIFYRPAGYLLVKVISRFPVTPNQVTGLSLLAGLASAWCFSTGRGPAIAWGGILYLVANILDCSDGQLARLKGNGTPLGRVVDGMADYVSSLAVFLAIGMGFSARGENLWLLVLIAGASSAAHAIIFDQRQGAYISALRGERSFTVREREKFSGEIKRLKTEGRDPLRVFAMRLYLNYLGLQGTGSGGAGNALPPDRRMVRFWSFLGPTTNRTTLVAAALAGRIDLYLWSVVLAGNLWLTFCLLNRKRLVPSGKSASGGV